MTKYTYNWESVTMMKWEILGRRVSHNGGEFGNDQGGESITTMLNCEWLGKKVSHNNVGELGMTGKENTVMNGRLRSNVSADCRRDAVTGVYFYIKVHRLFDDSYVHVSSINIMNCTSQYSTDSCYITLVYLKMLYSLLTLPQFWQQRHLKHEAHYWLVMCEVLAPI